MPNDQNDTEPDERDPPEPPPSHSPGLRERLSARLADLNVKTVVGTLQVHFPPLHALRLYAKQTYLRARRQPFEQDFQCLARVDFAPDEVLIDVGAHRGQSIDAMRLYHPDQPIVAFEPNPGLAVKLRNRFEEDQRLVIHNVALADTSGEFTLYVPSYNGLDFDIDGALTFGEHQWGHLRDTIIGFDESRLSYKKMRCQVWELDQFKLKARFVKIDTKGSEMNVLLGAMDTIKTHHPILLVANTSPGEVIELLGPMGYGEFHYDGQLHAGPGMRNTLYIHLEAGQQAP
jgi:FkbM family methyltransferase